MFWNFSLCLRIAHFQQLIISEKGTSNIYILFVVHFKKKMWKSWILVRVSCRNTSAANSHVVCVSYNVLVTAAKDVCGRLIRQWTFENIERASLRSVTSSTFSRVAYSHPPRLFCRHNAEFLSWVWFKVTAWVQILSFMWWKTPRRLDRSCNFTAIRASAMLCAFICEHHGR